MLDLLKKQIKKSVSFEAQLIIKDLILDLLDRLGINGLFRLINRKKMIILMYHGISRENFSFYHRRYLPKSTFIKQIKYLKKRNYKFITLTDWLNIVNNKKKVKHRYIILTFDDGFKNVVEQAYPIMKKYDAKGCFFIVSSIIGKDQLMWSDYLEVLVRNHKNSKFNFIFKNQEIIYLLNSELNIKKAYADIKDKLRLVSNKERISYLNKFMLSNNINNFENVPYDYLIANWEELNSLDKDILEVGDHTKTHPNLKMLYSEDEFHEEMFESKIEIEKKIGYPIKHFSYPAGSYNKNAIQYAKKYGYLTGVTVDYGFNSLKTDLFQLKRINITPSFILFKYKISGLYEFARNKLSLFN